MSINQGTMGLSSDVDKSNFTPIGLFIESDSPMKGSVAASNII